MEYIQQALYQQTRLTILLTTKYGYESSVFSNAYLHAWDTNVYPLLDDGADWHKPHKTVFEVSEDMVNELSNLLDDYWNNKKLLTFYDLEDIYNARHGTTWDRSKLINVCRYFFLHNTFDSVFWRNLTEPGKCPTEAHSICTNFGSIYFQ